MCSVIKVKQCVYTQPCVMCLLVSCIYPAMCHVFASFLGLLRVLEDDRAAFQETQQLLHTIIAVQDHLNSLLIKITGNMGCFHTLS